MRNASVARKTKETDIEAMLKLDGGAVEIETGVGFFDHMLHAMAAHAGWGLRLRCAGDLAVDDHHSVEDCGIVLGQALGQALGDKGGLARFGQASIPMDESLATAAVDVSGRAFLVFDAHFSQAYAGLFQLCLCEEFFRAFAVNAGITLHLRLVYGANGHHEAESLFKAAAHSLRRALQPLEGTLSTKGSLA
ncbi:MAG: imidazoleglycerol-phosphate dehydratase HisB [Oscillospiraceae bacterium]|jgi:imidazoleglycerol-phosphate dehydratase|nr:imidazoleglycerol-phosphate dehydratase HisB [Oscillospiraceae bacterium]